MVVQVSVSNNDQRRGKRDRKYLNKETVGVFVVLQYFESSITSKLFAND